MPTLPCEPHQLCEKAEWSGEGKAFRACQVTRREPGYPFKAGLAWRLEALRVCGALRRLCGLLEHCSRSLRWFGASLASFGKTPCLGNRDRGRYEVGLGLSGTCRSCSHCLAMQIVQSGKEIRRAWRGRSGEIIRMAHGLGPSRCRRRERPPGPGGKDLRPCQKPWYHCFSRKPLGLLCLGLQPDHQGQEAQEHGGDLPGTICLWWNVREAHSDCMQPMLRG